MINREDMLELTRRMTPARNCFDRVAGAYINDMGEVDERVGGGSEGRVLSFRVFG